MLNCFENFHESNFLITGKVDELEASENLWRNNNVGRMSESIHSLVLLDDDRCTG